MRRDTDTSDEPAMPLQASPEAENGLLRGESAYLYELTSLQHDPVKFDFTPLGIIYK